METSQTFPGELVEEAPEGIAEELFWGAWGEEGETLPNLFRIEPSSKPRSSLLCQGLGVFMPKGLHF